MIRIPEGDRFELRLADGAANPYLLPAALIASGLDGIAQSREPGSRADYNSFPRSYRNFWEYLRIPLNNFGIVD